jgi:hypothetical protein
MIRDEPPSNINQMIQYDFKNVISMLNTKLRTAHIVTAIITVTILIATPTANSRVLSQKTTRSAVVSGWIIFVGGPSRPNAAARHESGTVIVRTDDGHLITLIHATKKHGYRIHLAPGHYELSAIVSDLEASGQPNGLEEYSCGIQPKVTLHAGVNPPVDLTVGCDIP